MKKFIVLAFFLNIIVVQYADAHRIDLQYYIEDHHLIIKAIDGSNNPISEATVSVFNSNGELLDKGTTNNFGAYQFPIDQVEELQVRLYADAGHAKMLSISHEQLHSLLEGSSHDHEHPHEDDTNILSSQTTNPSKQTIISTENSWGMPERIILGFTFLLAAWSAWTSQRNTKKLDQLLNIKNHSSQ